MLRAVGPKMFYTMPRAACGMVVIPIVRGWGDRSADKGATGADATCLHPDDGERLRTRHLIIEERSEWEICEDDVQGEESERQPSFFL